MTHLIAIAATPTPIPTTGYDENQVTPGVIGFVVTAVLVVVVVLLLLDMVRRVQRVRYRAESQERIAEELAANAADGMPSTASDADRAPGDNEPGPGLDPKA